MAGKRDEPVSRPDEDFARARPASELVRAKRGRLAKSERKGNQTLRLDPDVLGAYRREGRGWQVLINDVLGKHMPSRRG